MEPLGDARGEEGDFTFAGLMFLKPVKMRRSGSRDLFCLTSAATDCWVLAKKINNLYSDEHNLASFAP
jgi:hypothetical protein